MFALLHHLVELGLVNGLSSLMLLVELFFSLLGVVVLFLNEFALGSQLDGKLEWNAVWEVDTVTFVASLITLVRGTYSEYLSGLLESLHSDPFLLQVQLLC
jgi:hypothetical protein